MAVKLPEVLTRLTPEQANAQAQRASQKVVFHLLCLLYFSRIFFWHFTEPAQLLPGATGFGWFFKYFTFCSFTAQTIQFVLCALDDAMWQTEKPPLRRAADVVSCTMFCFANTVSFMFYTMNFLTGGKAEEPCIYRPAWLSPAVHTYNAAAAWADILISDNRSFPLTSLFLCLVVGVGYGCWLQLCAYMNKKFPYPFLNHTRQPQTFLVTFSCCVLCMVTWFFIGRVLRGWLLKAWCLSCEWVEKKKAGQQAGEAEVDKKEN